MTRYSAGVHGRLADRLALLLVLAIALVAACAPASSGGGGDGDGGGAGGNTVTGTLTDAQSLSGQEIVRLSIRTDDGTIESMDVEDPSLAAGGLKPAEVRQRVGKRVVVEFREDGGRKLALQVTDAAP